MLKSDRYAGYLPHGESREDAENYLAEHFKLADREKLIEEVYAAIEG